MIKNLAAALAIVLAFAGPAAAHALDEYLQAVLISLHKDHIQVSMRLVPGVAVLHSVFRGIDANSDGVVSEGEQQAYAGSVLGDLQLSVDGDRLELHMVSVKFPTTDRMQQGLGEIQIELAADLPAGGTYRRVVFQNHHQSRISAYLANSLVPQDRGVQVIAQHRNQNQSVYQLDYQTLVDAGVLPLHAGVRSGARLWQWWPEFRASLGKVGGMASMFRLGMAHIAEGSDHLMFLLTLLLPAPLFAARARWARFASVRDSVMQIAKVVTAFTLGHSITLALATLEVVSVASGPIEVLIAVSILVSAAHALRPLFPGREAVVAAFFGLIHGLAFATTLGQLDLGRWNRVAGLLGFNMGIEAMQLVVVAAAMPSLLLLSRTRAYSLLRIGGALLAGFASAGWIAERLLGLQTSIDAIVDSAAQQAVWLAGLLFLFSLICWSLSNIRRDVMHTL